MKEWERPRENSIEALKHGMSLSDGVEFDLRMDIDGNLVIYHDEFVPGHGPIKGRCIENLHWGDLKDKGVTSFSELLAHGDFTDSWQFGGKTVDIELKMPHPVTGRGADISLRSMITKLEDELSDLELPDGSTLISSFSPRVFQVARELKLGLPVTRLMPHIRPWGRYWKVKRAVAMPHFARSSIQGIARYLRKNDSEIMGFAVEYLSGWTRWINPRLPVGIKGRGRDRLLRTLRGMGAFVWPAPIELEGMLLASGVSLVTDEMNPHLVDRPDGSFRWMRPASRPLGEEWSNAIGASSGDERADLVAEAKASEPTWQEIEEGERRKIIIRQGKKMGWDGSEDSWTHGVGKRMPWGVPRIIGHRGAGKTKIG